MGQVKINQAADVDWRTIRERAGGSPMGLDESELESKIAFHDNGGGCDLHLMEVDYPPGAIGVPHSHDEDEVMYVVSGEMQFGNKTVRAGSSIYVPRNTVYGFKAGEAGLRIIIARPRFDGSFHLKGG